MTTKNNNIKIGWAQTEITPQEPVLIAGQLHARRSEGIETPLTATALALQTPDDQVVFVSVEVVSIPDELRDSIREKIAKQNIDIDPLKLLINATHTHTSAELRPGNQECGVDLDVMDISKCIDFVAGRIASAVTEAWKNKKLGAIGYGLTQAVVGHNRRWVDDQNIATMYGHDGKQNFRHIEGYEDHSMNLLTTYDLNNNLTGMIVNIPCPSQVSEHQFELGADYWHETRIEMRQRLGEKLFVLGQCSAAGDLAPRPMYEKSAHARMLELKNRTHRQELASRIAVAIENVLPSIKKDLHNTIDLKHHVKTIELPLNQLSQSDVEDAKREIEKLDAQYKQELQKLADNPPLKTQTEAKATQAADPNQPDIKQTPRWYVPVTRAYFRKRWQGRVIERFNNQQAGVKTIPTEVHTLCLGDIVFASVQFEYYLDFGTQIKVRSKAMQTFLVQLAGGGTYLPSPRSVAGGGYGSVPASNVVGPEAGQVLADYIVEEINGKSS